MIERIESLSEEQVLYGFPGDDGWTGDTEVRLLELSESDWDPHPMQASLRYLLEVELVREVLEVWTKWRAGASPTTEEAVEAVIHYAVNDAYMPTD